MDSGASKSDDGQTQTVIAGWKNMDKYTHNTISAQPQPMTKISSNDGISCRFLPFMLSHQGNSIFKVISLMTQSLINPRVFASVQYAEQHQRICDWLFVFLKSS
ncbi:hypothetical protein DAPPUDRAFT_325765 [Daphnia pulex]|uniref:Uncharacterized protein n=1 Tax=Daphnia pulex TaxID=6669 RepID=E9H5H6_DAPPU|nr:hypothetical protein DAPPUDRAFT_325765 [Daphnia pulex]|eukprot:EFX72960.1 hypothetical protein DAPPUDRAFT_325765 [Daphnia pulex]